MRHRTFRGLLWRLNAEDENIDRVLAEGIAPAGFPAMSEAALISCGCMILNTTITKHWATTRDVADCRQ